MEHPSLFLTVIFILISFALVAANAFFVAAEFAIVKVRRTRLEELAGQGVKAARSSILCVDQLDDYLSATQLGITMVSLALGWIGEDAFHSMLTHFLPEGMLENNHTAHLIATGLSFFTITMLHVVLGELVPKSMAIQKAETVTLWISSPLRAFYRSTRPLIRAFTLMATFVLHRLGYSGLEEPPLSEEELKLVMKESHEEGVISESEAQIINKAFHFSDKTAADVMIPSFSVEFLSLSKSVEENIEMTRKRMHTRFPLCRSALDSIVGIVHMKDAWPLLAESRSNEAFVRVARAPIFVQSNTRLDQVLKEFKTHRAHIGVVKDFETQTVVGILTMEDILVELVGDIPDEHN